jgi:hypothetical protein
LTSLAAVGAGLFLLMVAEGLASLYSGLGWLF